jgi:phage terminase large subunit GpA-like protein
MEAVTDPNNGETVLVWGRQLGKSEVIVSVIGYHIHIDPSPMLLVQLSLDMAKKFSKKKLAPAIRETPVLRSLVSPARMRDGSNTILVKTFPGGDLTIAGANSAASFRQESRRVVLQDDIDGFPPSVGSEGDPCDLADGRAENYHNAILIKASTPTVSGASRIMARFELTDQSYYNVPCLRCGCWQVLKWRQVRWPKNEPEKACYVCEGCSAELTDFERVRMITQGEWRPTVTHRRRRGFHLSGLYRIMGLKEKEFASYMHQFAVHFLDAKHRGRESLKVWTNTFLAETWEEEGALPLDSSPLQRRAENYTPETLPEGVIIAIAAVDVQDRWLQVEIIGLGLDDETWGIETRSIEGNPDEGAVWEELADLLTSRYQRIDGMEITIHACAIDMRHKGDRVRQFIHGSGIPRIYPVYGAGSHMAQAALVTPRRPDRHGLRTYAVDTKTAKDIIFARLKLEVPGPRFQHFPNGNGYNIGYYEQLTAEVARPHYSHGFVSYTYEKVRDRNEALDIRVYLLACVDILKPNLTTLSKRMKTAGVTPRPAAPPPTGQPPRQRIKVGIGGFNMLSGGAFR